MKKTIIGVSFGVIAGIIDVIPMILQNLTWDASLSAFSMWIVNGFLIANSKLEMNSILKGVLISFAVLLPVAILIGNKEPASLIPISLMTVILGSALGYSIERFCG
jgi:threonine/homoserine efflux transporter RhtA